MDLGKHKDTLTTKHPPVVEPFIYYDSRSWVNGDYGSPMEVSVFNTVRDFYMPIINGRNFQNNFVSFLDLCHFI